VVPRLIHLRTLQLGPDELRVGAKVELDPALSFAEVARAIDEAERRVRAKVPSARVIYLEPDCYRPGAQPGPGLGPGRLTPTAAETPGQLLDHARRR
jgi:divalent metal cation (Fe/Co/Zn/Cd) transporter